MARKGRVSNRSGEDFNPSSRRLLRPQERVLLDHIEGRPIRSSTSDGLPARGMGRSPITAVHSWPPLRQRPPTTTPLKAAVSRVYSVVRSQPRPRPVLDRVDLSRLYKVLPRAARICVQREDRREVLFAQGTAGFGKRKSKGPYKFTSKSKVRCR